MIILGIESSSKIFEILDREIWVITARDGQRQSGLVATFVSVASLVPTLPRVTIGIAKHHYTHELIQASRAFCMHLIDENRVDWAWHFGLPSGREADKFRDMKTHVGISGSPILTGALAWLDCRVEATLDTGDRTIFLAEVIDASITQTAEPLTFSRLRELAPADKLDQMKHALERDVDLDRAAIDNWRGQSMSGR